MSIFKTALPCVLENRSDRSGPSKKFHFFSHEIQRNRRSPAAKN